MEPRGRGSFWFFSSHKFSVLKPEKELDYFSISPFGLSLRLSSAAYHLLDSFSVFLHFTGHSGTYTICHSYCEHLESEKPHCLPDTLNPEEDHRNQWSFAEIICVLPNPAFGDILLSWLTQETSFLINRGINTFCKLYHNHY